MKYFIQIYIISLLGAVCLIAFPLTVALAANDKVIDFLDDAFYDEEETEHTQVPDPLEPLNRWMFSFNDYSYTWVLEPVASGYSYVVPPDIRHSVDNFFYNLQEPVRCLNALAQARFSDAGTMALRFIVNSTGGVAGLGDPAGRELGLKAVDATLGETMGVWGVGDGFYMVVPLYGPTTLRDFTGTTVDSLALSPYYMWADGWEESMGIYLGKELNKLSLFLGDYEKMKQLSFDPYIAIRNGYFQTRTQMRNYKTTE